MFCGKSFRVCCIYAPNRNPARDQFFHDLWAKVDPSVPTILCGDFNAVFDRSVDQFWTRWDGSRASRIDLCGIPYVWVSSVLSCDLLPCPFSDHCGLLTVVSVPDVVPPGPGSSTFLSCRSRRMSF